MPIHFFFTSEGWQYSLNSEKLLVLYHEDPASTIKDSIIQILEKLSLPYCMHQPGWVISCTLTVLIETRTPDVQKNYINIYSLSGFQ